MRQHGVFVVNPKMRVLFACSWFGMLFKSLVFYDLCFGTNEMRADTTTNVILMQFRCCTTGHRLIETEGYGGL